MKERDAGQVLSWWIGGEGGIIPRVRKEKPFSRVNRKEEMPSFLLWSILQAR